jgi:hypothetical protein
MKFWTGSKWEGERSWDGKTWVDRADGANTPGVPSGEAVAYSTTQLSPATPPPPTGPTPPPPNSVTLNLASLQGQLGSLRMRMTATSWFLFAGALVVAISSFFPWVTGTLSDGLGDSYSETEGLTGAGRFVVIAIGVAIVAIGWPVLSNMALSRRRTISLTVVVGVLTLLAILFTASASTAGNTSGLTKPGPGFGTILCWVALIAVWVGLVRVWIKRRTPAIAPS